MVSSRAQEVAEILWELKRADKLATHTAIAGRAGFSAGSNGRIMQTTLRTVRRDWPHLEWWRVVQDDGTLKKGCEQEGKLREKGIDLEDAGGKDKDALVIKEFTQYLMTWEEQAQEASSTNA